MKFYAYIWQPLVGGKQPGSLVAVGGVGDL